jgi:nitrate reductase NapD
MSEKHGITRRALVTANAPAQHHISSAVIYALPRQREAVARALAAIPGVEVHASDGGRTVITIEGPTSGMLGETLTRISLMDGVISANMVFEHVDEMRS